MRKGFRGASRWLVLAVVGAACSDVGTTPVREPQGEDATSPGVASAPALSRRDAGEGYAAQGVPGAGFITGRDGQPMAVTFEVHHGLAIWQGDIVLGRATDIPTTRDALLRRRPGGPSFGVVTTLSGRRWPGGVVPFEIAGNLPNQARVTDAIAMVEQATAGVNLVPRNGEADYIRFVLSDGCSSEIGRIGGAQNINLGPNCGTGNAAHEILHALGMFHEQSRCDRDGFVEVLLDNVESGKEHNFDKECSDADDIGAYEEGSIMHYGTHFFSKNGSPTLRSLRGRDADMGQRAALGATDTETINNLYGANNVAPTAAFTVSPNTATHTEGSSIVFNGGTSSDPDDAVLTYAWTFGDGTTATGATPVKTYTDNGTYTATLTVSDGFATNAVSRTMTITNVVPVVFLGGAESRTEGQLFTRTGSFTDPGSDSWTATVDYGDGAGAQPLPFGAAKTFQLSHTYADNGAYTVTVRVTDDDGGTGSSSIVVTVANVAPTVNAGPDLTVGSGLPIAFSGTFTDPGILDAPWTWSINWGFGAPTTGATSNQAAAITASRLACAAGTYAGSLTVTDKDGGAGTDAFTITVPFRTVGIDITPTENPNPVNLSKRGLLPVAILSTATFDARTVDPATAMLGDGMGTDTPVAQQNTGRYQAKFEDVNRDGLVDLVLMFETEALVAGGELTTGTTQLVLRAFLADGCTNVRGVDAVVVRP